MQAIGIAKTWKVRFFKLCKLYNENDCILCNIFVDKYLFMVYSSLIKKRKEVTHMKQLLQGGVEMIEISSMEYAFSKLNFEKAEKQKEKKEKETIWKIWYRDENGKIRKCIRSDYDLKRSRDIHSRIITMIKWE